MKEEEKKYSVQICWADGGRTVDWSGLYIIDDQSLTGKAKSLKKKHPNATNKDALFEEHRYEKTSVDRVVNPPPV